MRNVKLYISLFFIHFISIINVQNIFGQTAKGAFIWGISGHPFTQEAYQQKQPQFQNSVTDQLDAIKLAGLGWYRMDIGMYPDGTIPNADGFAKLVKAAGEKKIKILPLLYLMGLDYNKSADDNYNLGYQIGKKFTTEHGQYFTHIELGNEQEPALLINGAASSGDKSSDYDLSKINILASYYKGMIAGIKAVKPSMQTIINTSGWVHYGYLELLQSAGVNYDIVGYHWYSEMGNLTDVRQYHYNMPNLLFQKFKKPIWLTEISSRNDNANPNMESVQTNWLNIYMKEARSNPHVKAVFFYELYDEPAFKNAESGYGIIKWGAMYNNPTFKSAFYAIKKYVALNK